MLTVRIDDEKHNSRILTNIVSVEDVIDPSMDDDRWPTAGIIIHYKDGTSSHYSRKETSQKKKFYVMNENGATVAQFGI